MLALISPLHRREKGKDLEIALVQLQARSHKEENRLKPVSEGSRKQPGCGALAAVRCPSSEQFPPLEGASA